MFCQERLKAKKVLRRGKLATNQGEITYIEIFVAEKIIIPLQYESHIDLMVFKP